MNIKTEEQSLAKYHVLHLVLGAIFAAIFLVVPKLVVVLLSTLLLAISMPQVIAPEFSDKRLDAAAVIVGAIIVAVIFHFLHKI